MAIPIGVWGAILTLAVLTTCVSMFTKDRSNYTDAISGILATLLWFVAGISCLLGIQTEYTTFTAGYLMWIFIIIGVIDAILTIVKILDIVTARKKETHTRFDPLGL